MRTPTRFTDAPPGPLAPVSAHTTPSCSPSLASCGTAMRRCTTAEAAGGSVVSLGVTVDQRASGAAGAA
jgi:hypothetical protein